MKHFKFYFLLVCLMAISIFSTQASHIVGLRITYEYIGGSYLFKLKLYRDCSGIQAPTNPEICFTSASGCAAQFTTTLIMDVGTSGFEVPFNSCAAVGATFCSGGNIFAFEEYNYTGVVSVPPCDDWVVSYTECCRNAAITNLVNPDFYSAYVETHFDNLNYPTNSSPQFNAVPVNYYCAGVPAFVDYSAFDIDGDSLSYEFTDIHDGSCGNGTPITYAAPYTYDQPLATLAPTTFDPYNGQIAFTPSSIQISVVGFKVNEYRNGVLIGSVRRDDEIVVVGNFVNPDTIAGTVYYDMNSNSTFDGGDVPASAIVVHMSPGNTYQSTFTNGKYLFQTIPGNFTVDIPNLPLYTTSVPTNYSINTTGGNFYGGNDFALQPISNMNDLEVYLNTSTGAVPGWSFPLTINYQNSGTTQQSNVDVELVLDNLLSYVSASPAPSNVNGNTLTWNFATLDAFTGGIISVDAVVDTLAQMGDSVECVVNITPLAGDITPLNNTDNITEIVMTSYDPNSKEVSPEGNLSTSFVANHEWLNYTINFQNLGTAPANTIRILDLIDAKLYQGSIELVASSKPCVMSLSSPNRLEFTFYNANLPPASTDEPHSHGFVEFRIRTGDNLYAGSIISNGARIYFDFNAPIFTNFVQNTVGLTTSLPQEPVEGLQFNVFPNPASENVSVEIMSNKAGTIQVELYNVLGVLVNKLEWGLMSGYNSYDLNIDKLVKGMYFIRFSNNGHTTETKLVKN